MLSCQTSTGESVDGIVRDQGFSLTLRFESNGYEIAGRFMKPRLLANLMNSSSSSLSQWLTASGIPSASFGLVYSANPSFPIPSSSHTHTANRPLRISVLDSSFNPPSRAHLALATPSSINHFDAYLLILSTKNADKLPKPGETTTDQRLRMMIAMAQEIEETSRTTSGERSTSNIAIAYSPVVHSCVNLELISCCKISDAFKNQRLSVNQLC